MRTFMYRAFSPPTAALLAAAVFGGACVNAEAPVQSERLDPMDLSETEREAIVVRSLFAGSMRADPSSEHASLINGMLDRLQPGVAHAEPVSDDWDFCIDNDTPVFASMSHRGASGVYGAEGEEFYPDANSDYCQDRMGNANSNAAGDKFQSFALYPVQAECSWGATYNITGNGIVRFPTFVNHDIYGSFNINRGAGGATMDCSWQTVHNNPNAETEVWLDESITNGACTPTVGAAVDAAVVVDWESIDAGEYCVLTLGGVDAGADPVADCGANTSSFTLSQHTFDGSASYDPDGGPVDLVWSLTAPTGSAASLSAVTDADPWIDLDLAGTYTANLTVTTERGTTDTCSVSVTAVPYENFRAELYWTIPDDLDLHLLNNGNNLTDDASLVRSSNDCYWSGCQSYLNEVRDWGVSDYTPDNPRLDRDDIPATGPENINIDAPQYTATSPGWYTVMVYDYPWTVSDDAANEAYVNLYLNGALAYTTNFTVTGEQGSYYVARVHWPSGAIVPCNGTSGC